MQQYSSMIRTRRKVLPTAVGRYYIIFRIDDKISKYTFQVHVYWKTGTNDHHPNPMIHITKGIGINGQDPDDRVDTRVGCCMQTKTNAPEKI